MNVARRVAKSAPVPAVQYRSAPPPPRAPIAPFLKPSNATPYTRYIYAYYNVRTKQTLYSLQRCIDNSLAMQQLTFVGKQTHPAALRKDVWLPLMTVVFPESDTALYRTHSCYRQLREYKKLHELSPPIETVRKPTGQMLTKKRLGYVLMNQKYNAVADLAAVLANWPAGIRKKLRQLQTKHERFVALKKRKPASINKPVLRAAQQDNRRIELLGLVAKELESGANVEVHWANVLDAEYAKEWPEGVVHTQMKRDVRDRHHSPIPARIEPVPEPVQIAEKEMNVLEEGSPKSTEDGQEPVPAVDQQLTPQPPSDGEEKIQEQQQQAQKPEKVDAWANPTPSMVRRAMDPRSWVRLMLPNILQVPDRSNRQAK